MDISNVMASSPTNFMTIANSAHFVSCGSISETKCMKYPGRTNDLIDSVPIFRVSLSIFVYLDDLVEFDEEPKLISESLSLASYSIL